MIFKKVKIFANNNPENYSEKVFNFRCLNPSFCSDCIRLHIGSMTKAPLHRQINSIANPIHTTLINL